MESWCWLDDWMGWWLDEWMKFVHSHFWKRCSRFGNGVSHFFHTSFTHTTKQLEDKISLHHSTKRLFSQHPIIKGFAAGNRCMEKGLHGIDVMNIGVAVGVPTHFLLHNHRILYFTGYRYILYEYIKSHKVTIFYIVHHICIYTMVTQTIHV